LKYLYFRILQGRWQHGEEVGNWYPNGLEKTICKWDIFHAGRERVKIIYDMSRHLLAEGLN
jgi:hypothetical protein